MTALLEDCGSETYRVKTWPPFAALAFSPSASTATHPQTRRHAVPLDDAEDQVRLVVEFAGKPPAEQFDPLHTKTLHLLVELRDVLGPVVVGIVPIMEGPSQLR